MKEIMALMFLIFGPPVLIYAATCIALSMIHPPRSKAKRQNEKKKNTEKR